MYVLFLVLFVVLFVLSLVVVLVFFFKQKTAYEMRISDWSSDVCSSDLYGDMTYYSIAIQAVERPIVVSMRNTIGRPSLVSGEKVQVGWGPESLVPLV